MDDCGGTSESCTAQILAPAHAAVAKKWAYCFSCAVRPSHAVLRSKRTQRAQAAAVLSRECTKQGHYKRVYVLAPHAEQAETQMGTTKRQCVSFDRPPMQHEMSSQSFKQPSNLELGVEQL